jgi:hypothetical protein
MTQKIAQAPLPSGSLLSRDCARVERLEYIARTLRVAEPMTAWFHQGTR